MRCLVSLGNMKKVVEVQLSNEVFKEIESRFQLSLDDYSICYFDQDFAEWIDLEEEHIDRISNLSKIILCQKNTCEGTSR